MSHSFLEISRVIRTNRKLVGLSQSQLALAIPYKNGQFVSNIERSICSIPGNKIAAMAEALKIDPEVIINALIEDKRVTLRNQLKESLK